MSFLYAARTVELLGERARSLLEIMKELAAKYTPEGGDPALFIHFAATGFLNRM